MTTSRRSAPDVSGRSLSRPDALAAVSRVGEVRARRVALAAQLRASQRAVHRRTATLQRAEDFAARLESLASALASTVTAGTATEVFAKAARSLLAADRVAVSLVNEDGELEVAAALGYPAHTIPTAPVPLTPGTPHGTAVTSGRGVFIATRADYRRVYPASTLDAPGALAVIPLKTATGVLGMAAFAFSTGRAFARDERAFLQAAGRLCAGAVERSRVLESERAATAVAYAFASAAEHAANRADRLQAVATRLARSATGREVVQAVVDAGRDVIGAFAGGAMMLTPDGLSLEPLYLVDMGVAGAHRLDLAGPDRPHLEILRTGEPVFTASRAEFDERYPDAAPIVDARAAAGVPIVIGEEVKGVLSWVFATPHEFSDEERSFLVSLGQQCSQSLERALLYEHERQARLGAEAALVERERLHGRLVQAERLETMGQVAAGIAHDFNNLLGVILNHSSLALDDLSEAHPLRTDVEAIREAARRGTELSRQLSLFGRREQPVPPALDLAMEIAQSERLLRRTLTHRIALVLAVEPDLPQVRIDAGLFQQVLINLATNARDAIRDRGALSISAARVVLGETAVERLDRLRTGTYVEIRVEDDGEGMTDDVRARAFEPFFMAERPEPRTGLGLATVYGIVSAAGGATEITSELGSGTLVRLLLPADAEPTTAGPTPSGTR